MPRGRFGGLLDTNLHAGVVHDHFLRVDGWVLLCHIPELLQAEIVHSSLSGTATTCHDPRQMHILMRQAGPPPCEPVSRVFKGRAP